VDTLLRCGTLEEASNFNSGTENIEKTLIQSSKHHGDKVFRVNVISDGDPLEIFTERDGEVIFKKYSPMGELAEFAVQICDSLHKTTGAIAAICDRDTIIAVAGGARKELLEKRISNELEQIMENRGLYGSTENLSVPAAEGNDTMCIAVAAPILSAGDVLGCVIFAAASGAAPFGETEQKLAQTIAGFLGRQMEE